MLAYEIQPQDTSTGVAPPEKVKVPLPTQGILEIVTCTDLPGVSVLPDVLKETPFILLLTDQVRLPCEFEVSVTVTMQDQPDA